MNKYVAHGIRIFFLLLSVVLIVTGKMPLWLGIFAISLIVAIGWGRLFCGYVCPMNTLMLPVEWLSIKLGWQSKRLPRIFRTRWLPYALLGLSVAGVLLTRRILQQEFPLLPLFLILAVLITLRWKPEAFHNGVCPFGALQRLAGKGARHSETVDPATCIGCKKCAKVCPSAAFSFADGKPATATIDPALCHQCTNCVPVCPTASIRYRKVR